MKQFHVRDPLYGGIEFEISLANLIRLPVMQRLRHVRLSNIDSVDLPGIANISRFEHVLGAGHLAASAGFLNRLSADDERLLCASVLLHDCAITSFGHLVEEALQYASTGFDHENRLYEILCGFNGEEIGGINRQIISGRSTGLEKWAREYSNDATELLSLIVQNIRGIGKFGRTVAGEIDLDNIDNVFRIAYHMGLPFDRETPKRLAQSIVDFDANDGTPVFTLSALADIERWLEMRHEVYEHLMLAPNDFAGKLMLLYASVKAFRANELTKTDWSQTDDLFIRRLLDSSITEVRETVQRWRVGEPWVVSPISWMSGARPSYPDLLRFSEFLSERLNRTCFTYGIKDKRTRRLPIKFEDGSNQEFGASSSKWIFAVGSPVRKPFSSNDKILIIKLAAEFFDSEPMGSAEYHDDTSTDARAQSCLI
jgi:uncharacterized protein